MPPGADLPTLGDVNQRLVLDVIRRHPGGIGRVAVGGATGLTPQTVSNIVRRLTEAGLVFEGERVRTARGKPPPCCTSSRLGTWRSASTSTPPWCPP